LDERKRSKTVFFSRGNLGFVCSKFFRISCSSYWFWKTFSVFLAVVNDFLNHPEKVRTSRDLSKLQLLWVTPLRSLSKDIAKAMQTAINEIGLDWTVGVRNGDISASEKQKQTKNMPEILVVTPESLHLLLAQKI
jgi:ATP-dependent Lhr-like helicase